MFYGYVGWAQRRCWREGTAPHDTETREYVSVTAGKAQWCSRDIWGPLEVCAPVPHRSGALIAVVFPIVVEGCGGNTVTRVVVVRSTGP